MPEGDAIALFRFRLEERLVNHELTLISSRWDSRIKGLGREKIIAVKAHGKVLWLEFSDDTALVVHLGMKGRWRFSDTQSKNSSDGKDGLALATPAGTAVLRLPKVLDRVPTSRIFEHQRLRWVGPDILADDVNMAEIIVNARAKDSEDKDIAELLLDQEICAGPGNIFKCETLAALRLHPWTPANVLNDARLHDVYSKTRETMLGRLAGKLDPAIARTRPFLPLVYQRHKEGCRRCGNEVVVEEHGGEHSRLTWWCPICQTLES
ncbi:MAG: hypothetical protein GY822_27315 [Deltaproteobacteria bacterium]|nr:hypothetical protein [Deltaproteobacteria bacterium]